MNNAINENILPDILLLQKSIPKDISPLEQVRWIYINLGKLFSYDFRVAKEPEYVYNKKIDFQKGIDRYQTCIQISYILDTILNQLPNVKKINLVFSSLIDGNDINKLKNAYLNRPNLVFVLKTKKGRRFGAYARETFLDKYF